MFKPEGYIKLELDQAGRPIRPAFNFDTAIDRIDDNMRSLTQFNKDAYNTFVDNVEKVNKAKETGYSNFIEDLEDIHPLLRDQAVKEIESFSQYDDKMYKSLDLRPGAFDGGAYINQKVAKSRVALSDLKARSTTYNQMIEYYKKRPDLYDEKTTGVELKKFLTGEIKEIPNAIFPNEVDYDKLNSNIESIISKYGLQTKEISESPINDYSKKVVSNFDSGKTLAEIRKNFKFDNADPNQKAFKQTFEILKKNDKELFKDNPDITAEQYYIDKYIVPKLVNDEEVYFDKDKLTILKSDMEFRKLEADLAAKKIDNQIKDIDVDSKKVGLERSKVDLEKARVDLENARLGNTKPKGKDTKTITPINVDDIKIGIASNMELEGDVNKGIARVPNLPLGYENIFNTTGKNIVSTFYRSGSDGNEGKFYVVYNENIFNESVQRYVNDTEPNAQFIAEGANEMTESQFYDNLTSYYNSGTTPTGSTSEASTIEGNPRPDAPIDLQFQ